MASVEFIINKTFSLSTRKMFVVTGDVACGNISAGMSLESKKHDIYLKVNSIEMLTTSNEERLALTFVYNDSAELRRLQKLKNGETVIIE